MSEKLIIKQESLEKTNSLLFVVHSREKDASNNCHVGRPRDSLIQYGPYEKRRLQQVFFTGICHTEPLPSDDEQYKQANEKDL
jgi:hypothetical protein